jgi:hypothetical protein
MLVTIPGIGEQVAQSIIAEIGVDMQRFPQMLIWPVGVALCPGNNESAGKRRSGKTTKGNPYVRTHWCKRRGPPRTPRTAICRRSFTVWSSAWKKEGAGGGGAQHSGDRVSSAGAEEHYQDLGADYFDRRAAEVQANAW